MERKRGYGFTKLVSTRVIIDEGIQEIMDLLGPNPMDFEVERILRLGACGTNGYRTNVDDVWRRLGSPKKIIWSGLKQQGLPTPGKLLAWGNLIPAIGTLKITDEKSPMSSMDEISIHWGFSSGGDISSKCKCHADVYPVEITGGVTDLAERFVRVWREKQQPKN